jgi:hypothetical protein
LPPRRQSRAAWISLHTKIIPARIPWRFLACDGRPSFIAGSSDRVLVVHIEFKHTDEAFGEVSIAVTRKPIKNVHLSVHPEGRGYFGYARIIRAASP